MFYNLPNEIITKIYTYDTTYRDIYNKNMEYIKTFINRNTLYDYNNDLWYCYYTQPSEDKYIFIRRYSSFYSTESKYKVTNFHKAILNMKIGKNIHRISNGSYSI